MLNILTRPPKIFFKGALKYYVARVATVFGRVRGPTSVLISLKRGLSEISCLHKTNAPLNANQIVHVASNIEALRYAIKAKKVGRIKKLVAGPNLVIFPNDHEGIIKSPEIDGYLVPSIWVKEMYKKISPVLGDKIHLWPAGVSIPDQYKKNTSPQRVLIFRKNIPSDLYQSIISILLKHNIKIEVLKYGIFTQKKYFKALRHADFMVYLQEVESQGLALQEAWARNIPTLVWNKGEYTYPNGITVTGNVSAPYMTEHCGVLFTGKTDFEEKLKIFLRKFESFEPRKYCEEELSDKASATKYVKILSKIYPS